MSAGAEHLMATLSEIVGRPVTMGDGTIDTMIEALAALHQRLRALEPAEVEPRPAEPKGLGSVVQDGNGTLWVRATVGAGAVWRGADWYGSEGRYRVWELIQGPVTVMSQGWSE